MFSHFATVFILLKANSMGLNSGISMSVDKPLQFLAHSSIAPNHTPLHYGEWHGCRVRCVRHIEELAPHLEGSFRMPRRKN